MAAREEMQRKERRRREKAREKARDGEANGGARSAQRRRTASIIVSALSAIGKQFFEK